MKNRSMTRVLPVLILAALLLTPAAAAERTLAWDETYALSAGDLQAEESDGILLTGVPEEDLGTLMLGSRRLRAGDVVEKERIAQITFLPAGSGQGEATISCLRLTETGSSPYTMTLNLIPRRNQPPTAEDSEFKTYKNIPGQVTLTVSDPEDGPLNVTILREPRRGSVEVDGNGTVTYTPKENQVGKDSFSYYVTDQEGAQSQEATVRVEILKPSHAQTYGDMAGDPAELAAVWLREEGIFTGESVGGTMLFRPEETVTRGEFLAMCAGLVGPGEETVSTGFSDEASTPAWLGPHATTALRCGYLNGVPSPGGLRLDADAPMTQAQGARMVSAILGLGGSGTETVMGQTDGLPVWVRDSAEALSRLELFTITDANGPMTRRDAALLLYRAGQYAAAQEKSTGLLAWAAR